MGFKPTHAFQACALNHSAISPAANLNMAVEPLVRNGVFAAGPAPETTNRFPASYDSGNVVVGPTDNRPANARMASGSFINEVTLSETDLAARRPAIICRRASTTALDLVWAFVAGTAIPLSLLWDFSWESSIGVDRFWSPPHLATHTAVWLNALLSLWLIFKCTVARRADDEVAKINIGPLRGPSGAWVLLWSALLFEATIPLDLWWQRAYGLGAGLWPPPQILKTVSFFGMLFGSMLLAVARRNAGAAANDVRSSCNIFNELRVAWFGGLAVALCALILVMTNYPNRQHTAFFYLVSSAVYPALLLLTACAVRLRWGATAAALAYLVASGVTIWLLPLFPAHPLTPPIHNPITRMMPPPFPLLLFVPAAVFDGLRYAIAKMRSEAQRLGVSLLAGTVFIAAFAPLQWFFAKFLLSPAADNWFFAGGGRHWPYFLKIDQARSMFWIGPSESVSIETFVLAAALAGGSAWLGLTIGAWLQKVQR